MIHIVSQYFPQTIRCTKHTLYYHDNSYISPVGCPEEAAMLVGVLTFSTAF